MPTARDILTTKGSTVYSTDPDSTVLNAVQHMNQHKLGSLVVLEDGRLVGMFTERDVLRRIVGEQRNPSSTRVSEVMTRNVICCPPDTDLEEVSAIMKQQRIRHVPVVDENGRLHGVISIGDVNACYASSQEQTITFLNEYIYGRV